MGAATSSPAPAATSDAQGQPDACGVRQQQQCATCSSHALEDLPHAALQLLAQHTSTPSTPAACLLPLVSRGWGKAVHHAQLLVDITVDLAPCVKQPHASGGPGDDLDAAAGVQAAAAAAPAAAAAAAAAPVLAASMRGPQLAAWLAKNRGTVRSLRIPRGPLRAQLECRKGWVQDLTKIRQALTARQQTPASGPALPHLVQLELPVLGLPGTTAMLKALAGCTGLQRLVLQPPCRMKGAPVTFDAVGAAVSPLVQLRTLHLEFPDMSGLQPVMGASDLAGLLRQLPASLKQLQLDGLRWGASDSIPVSCMTHLVNLQAWDKFLCYVPLVVDDLSSSSSSSSGGGRGAAGLTALTTLHCIHRLQGSDARLQAPNLRYLDLDAAADPEALQQLQGRAQLRHLDIRCDSEDDVAQLGALTQLQDVEVYMFWYGQLGLYAQPSVLRPVADAVARLTQLTTLSLQAHAVLAGGPTMLTPLTQLKVLKVECNAEMLPEHYPEGAEGFAATPAGAVVGVVAAAVGAGWRPLQKLVLLVVSLRLRFQWPRQELADAARAALPGVEVAVTSS